MEVTKVVIKPSRQEIDRYKTHKVTPIFFKELKNFDSYFPRVEYTLDIGALKEVQDLEAAWTRGAVIKIGSLGGFADYDYKGHNARLIIASKDLKLESRMDISSERMIKWDKSKELIGFKLVSFDRVKINKYFTHLNLRAYPVYAN